MIIAFLMQPFHALLDPSISPYPNFNGFKTSNSSTLSDHPSIDESMMRVQGNALLLVFSHRTSIFVASYGNSFGTVLRISLELHLN